MMRQVAHYMMTKYAAVSNAIYSKQLRLMPLPRLVRGLNEVQATYLDIQAKV